MPSTAPPPIKASICLLRRQEAKFLRIVRKRPAVDGRLYSSVNHIAPAGMERAAVYTTTGFIAPYIQPKRLHNGSLFHCTYVCINCVTEKSTVVFLYTHTRPRRIMLSWKMKDSPPAVAARNTLSIVKSWKTIWLRITWGRYTATTNTHVSDTLVVYTLVSIICSLHCRQLATSLLRRPLGEAR